MARRHRLEQLDTKQAEALRIFALQYFPNALANDFLDSIEKTGTVSDELLNKGGFSPADAQNVKEKVAGFTQGILSQKDALEGFLKKQGTDEANLTDEELKDRIGAFEGLPGTARTGFDDVGLRKKITDVFQKHKLGPSPNSGKNPWEDPTVIDSLINRFYDDPNFDINVLPQYLRDSAKEVQRSIADYLPNTIDTSADVTRIQGMLKDRGFVADQNAQVENFLNTAPGELEAERKKFFDTQRNRAKDYVTGFYAPQVAEQLAARQGLGDSGQVGVAIESKYSDLLAGIDQSAIEQLKSNSDFFADQAYNKTFNDLIAARAGVEDTISNERSNLRTKTQTDFSKRQADLESKFNLDLFKQQSQSAYNTYQNQVLKQRSDARAKNEADTIGQVTQAGTTVALAALL